MNVETQRLGITPLVLIANIVGIQVRLRTIRLMSLWPMSRMVFGYCLTSVSIFLVAGQKNPSRCDAAGIPPEFQCFKTKAELVYELICQVIEAKIKFSFVAMDFFMENTLGYYPALRTKESRMCPTLVVKIA